MNVMVVYVVLISWHIKDIFWMDGHVLTMTYKSLDTKKF